MILSISLLRGKPFSTKVLGSLSSPAALRRSATMVNEFRKSSKVSIRVVFPKVKSLNKELLSINMTKIVRSLSKMGFCDRIGNPKPNFRYFQESQQGAINRVSSVLRGISSFYYLAKWKRRCIERCSYILTHSLAMMFAAKYKLGTRAKVFTLAGRNLQKPLKSRCEAVRRYRARLRSRAA